MMHSGTAAPCKKFTHLPTAVNVGLQLFSGTDTLLRRGTCLSPGWACLSWHTAGVQL